MDALTYATLKRGWVRPRIFAAAALAVAAMLPAAKPVQAATLTVSYDTVAAVSNNASFSSGVTFVNLGGPNPVLTLQPGQFFQFGVDTVVSNNANPDSGSAYDMANQQVTFPAKGVAEPKNLGLNGVGFHVTTLGGLTNVISPLFTTAGDGSRTFSTAVIDPNSSIDPEFEGDPGDVSGGAVGVRYQLGAGYAGLGIPSFNSTKASPMLSQDLSTAEIFGGLVFMATGVGTTTLTTSVDPSLLTFVSLATPGAVNGDGSLTAPTFVARVYDSSSDSLLTGGIGDNLPVISVTVTPVPEPMSLGLFGAVTGLLLLRRRKSR